MACADTWCDAAAAVHSARTRSAFAKRMRKGMTPDLTVMVWGGGGGGLRGGVWGVGVGTGMRGEGWAGEGVVVE